METDKPQLLPDRIKKDNKFFNVRTKLRNPKLGNETAWEEAQPLFKFFTEDYPEKYKPYLSIIHDVFNLRREAFLGRILSSKASEEIKARYNGLNPVEQDLLGGSFSHIRNLFEIPAPFRKFHSS